MLAVNKIIEQAKAFAQAQMKVIDEVALYNQRKVLDAFRTCGVADRHFKGSTGYGYDDIGRDTLSRVFAEVFCAESSIVSPLITGGTHALVLALFGLLRPGDGLVSVTGEPYDTLYNAISGNECGSMREYNIAYDQIDMVDGGLDYVSIQRYFENHSPKVAFITRSRGYSSRSALSIDDIQTCINTIKRIKPQTIVVVDNCYGEFCERREPTEVGADVAVGSLIKNIGGGIAPTGAYIVGKKEYIEAISFRFIAPGLGCEVGSFEGGYRSLYQGLFLAPHVVAGALKGSLLFAHAFTLLGLTTVPKPAGHMGDIIRSIVFDTKDQLVAFIQSIQRVSPVDSNVVPMPWDMPGYQEQVIMAAGTFVGGASIELSADAPIKEPYIAYVQGALTWEHAQLAVEYTLQSVIEHTPALQ